MIAGVVILIVVQEEAEEEVEEEGKEILATLRPGMQRTRIACTNTRMHACTLTLAPVIRVPCKYGAGCLSFDCVMQHPQVSATHALTPLMRSRTRKAALLTHTQGRRMKCKLAESCGDVNCQRLHPASRYLTI